MTYSYKVSKLCEMLKGGAQTIYDEDIHIPKLLSIFEQGGNISTFCVDAEISRFTFYAWMKKHSKFKEAYGVAQELACHWFETEAMANMGDPSFNLTLWTMMMKNRFGLTSERKLKIQRMRNANTPLSQLKVLRNEIADGNLTAAETTHMSNLVSTSLKVEAQEVLQKDVKEIKELLGDKIK